MYDMMIIIIKKPLLHRYLPINSHYFSVKKQTDTHKTSESSLY